MLSNLGDIGERKIIEIIMDQLDHMPGMPIPFGDDVSAIRISGEKMLIVKTDMLVGKTDIPKNMSLKQAARKAVIMNVSDLASKGVKPIASLVSLGLPKKLTVEDVKEIGVGLNDGCREYDSFIIGGDTGESTDLIINIAMFGLAEKNKIITRSGATPGDIVAVTGNFGKTSVGLKILLENLSSDFQDDFLDAVFMPNARLKEGVAIFKTEAATSSIDSSDGLAWSLHELSKASNVGFIINNLPINDKVKNFAEINNYDLKELILYGGEEYELVLTIKPKLWGKAKAAVSEVKGKLIPIGKVIAPKNLILDFEGKKCVIEPRGWEHFRTKQT